MRWGREQRLEFIEFRLFWEGGLNRSDLVDHFGISVPQASKDLSYYQELAPGNMAYDTSQKRYFAEPNFTLRLIEPDPYRYLTQLRSIAEDRVSLSEIWISVLPQVDVGISQRRDIDLSVLRMVLAAIRGSKSLEVRYQSMNADQPEPLWREITPHALGFDGLRWHARAFCHKIGEFKDFLLPRILEVGAFGKPGLPQSSDWHWNNFIDIELTPHPKLTKSQQDVVSKDFGFREGTGVLPVRHAMLFYALKSLGLLEDGVAKDPRRQHIVARNQTELEDALRASDRISGQNEGRSQS